MEAEWLFRVSFLMEVAWFFPVKIFRSLGTLSSLEVGIQTVCIKIGLKPGNARI